MLDSKSFHALAKEGYQRVPLVVEAFADLETPLSLYLKLAAGHANSFLLESVVGGERFGRFSFIGLPARRALRVHIAPGATRTDVLDDGQVIETDTGNPLDFIASYQSRFKVYLPDGMPRFCGGLAGYFGYDTVRLIEHKLAATKKEGGIGTPDILLLQTEELAVIDNLSGKLSLIVYADPNVPGAYEAAQARLTVLGARLLAPVRAPAVPPSSATPIEREFDRAAFEDCVRKGKDYIASGDCMQIVLGQRLKKRYNAAPLSLYRALRSLNPSPYMYFYDFGDFQVVGSSPEILVREESVPDGTAITIRPIAGTRPRGTTPDEDQAAWNMSCWPTPKERAEHVMLIDLARNDIGRIAQTGSVKVTEAFGIERYSHVMHIVSNVEGRLRPGLSALDVLRASFPRGHAVGCAQDPCDGDHRRAGAHRARRLRRGRRVSEFCRRHGCGHRHPHGRHQGRHALCAGGRWRGR